MDKRDLQQRTKRFALRAIKAAGELPLHGAGRVIANQLARYGTSGGANYRSACRSRSMAKFISKLGIVEEEADKSAFWMELIIEGGLRAPGRLAPLLSEANELVSIMAASRRTAHARGKIANRKSEIGNRQ